MEKIQTNKEIIIEELKRLLTFHGYYIPEHDYEGFAKEILPRLQTLDKKRVEKIIFQTSSIEELELKSGAKIAYRVIGPVSYEGMIDQICQLIPGKEIMKVRIEFYDLDKKQTKHLFYAEKELRKAGVNFNTGYDFQKKRRDWELDWSLKGAKVRKKSVKAI